MLSIMELIKGEKGMKRIFFALLMVILSVSSYGADTNEICKRNTMMMIVLQKNVDGSVTEIDTDTLKWVVDYGYDIFSNSHSESISAIKGSTTCNEIGVKSAIDGSSSNAGAAEPGDANTFLRAAPGDIGTNCWCKMDGPVTSWWVYLKTYDSADACASGCTSYCATGMANNTEMSNGRLMRHALFDAIW